MYTVVFVYQIFKTSSFSGDDVILGNFLKAPIRSIAEALGSPMKTRMSITATVKDVCMLFYNLH